MHEISVHNVIWLFQPGNSVCLMLSKIPHAIDYNLVLTVHNHKLVGESSIHFGTVSYN